MNEDERGITPAGETSITVEQTGDAELPCLVTVERGNGDSVQVLYLTGMERGQLAGMLGANGSWHMSFTNVTRRAG